MKLKSKNKKRWNGEDGTRKKSDDVNKKGREVQKIDFLCVLKLKLINQVRILKLLYLSFDLVWSDQTLKIVAIVEIVERKF